ncbi:MAG: nucleotide-binding protein [Methanothrix sp.]|jgi:predicted nucleotide-binding protein|nr:nucleotide-binding protein [Methanothrix sp.]
MAIDREPVPRGEEKPIKIDAELVPTEGSSDSQTGEALSKMEEQLGSAVQGMLFQNVQQVDIAARTAKALFDEVSKQKAPKDELLAIEIIKNLISLYSSLTQIMIFITEGRFERAIEKISEGLADADKSITALKDYEQLPYSDKEFAQISKPLFSIFQVVLNASDAWIRAEMVGYQGNISRYVELLQEAVIEYRRAESIPTTLDPTYISLVGLCATQAERLKTRIDEFSKKQALHTNLTPKGDKIFIIHGHDEGKWRELQDILEDLNQEIVVLKEEPSAGETIIEKFEKLADDCCYAFALITPDDLVKKKGNRYSQARPNVLFELGWFYGRFGRDRVCIIKKADTEMPSDLSGILSIDILERVSEGLKEIQDELQRIGLIKDHKRKKTSKRSAKRPAKKRN